MMCNKHKHSSKRDNKQSQYILPPFLNEKTTCIQEGMEYYLVRFSFNIAATRHSQELTSVHINKCQLQTTDTKKVKRIKSPCSIGVIPSSSMGVKSGWELRDKTNNDPHRHIKPPRKRMREPPLLGGPPTCKGIQEPTH